MCPRLAPRQEGGEGHVESPGSLGGGQAGPKAPGAQGLHSPGAQVPWYTVVSYYLSMMCSYPSILLGIILLCRPAS